MRFYKYQGLGNDYVLIDNLGGEIEESRKSSLAKELCDRRFGIGADGLLFAESGPTMRIFNPDGSEAEMCGNGIRCFARYLHDHVDGNENDKKSEYDIQTLAGTQKAVVDGEQITVWMPQPVDEGEVGLDILGSKLTFRKVSVGNPHAIIFESFDNWKELGGAVENNPAFPNRTNVEFVKITSKTSCTISVWERGAGPTLACGTGAVAACFAGVAGGRLEKNQWIEAKLPGGILDVKIGEDVLMRGPAEEVFSGEKTI